MEAFLQSFFLVAVSEIGDKTQILALLLAARYRKPWTIMAGILVATVLNHWVAAYFGQWGGAFFDRDYLKWILFLLFVGFGFWILIPDKEQTSTPKRRLGVFLNTAALFFMAEMGDKTQLATVALAANYQDVIAVTAGSTLGMMTSNGLAVFFGDRVLNRIPLQWIRRIAAALFILFGFGILVRG